MTAELHDTAPIRAGEELNVAALERCLQERLPAAAGPLVIEQFPSGYSNLTYLLRLGATELVLRRGPFGNQVKTAHDMGREYRVLSALAGVYPLAPRPCFYGDDVAVLGAPFYVMERRRGIILRRRLPRGLSLEPATARALGIAVVDALAALHALDYQAAGLASLGKPDGYVARQVNGWAERYVKARTHDVPAMESVSRWLVERIPRESGASLIHNDYKYDNLILDPGDLTRIVAVLDWEMATVGDPLMDLGTTLGYWVEAGDPPELQREAMGPTNLPGSLTRRELVERYAQQAGRDVGAAVYYYVFGLFKVAVIVQQIYARYERGHTQDERFAHLDRLVAILAEQAARALEVNRL